MTAGGLEDLVAAVGQSQETLCWINFLPTVGPQPAVGRNIDKTNQF
jgi:hypothetical protein